MSFLDELANKGVIKQNQISEIVRRADQKYDGDIYRAMEDFNISEDAVTAAKGDYFGLPAKKVDAKSFSPDYLKYIPEDSADHYKVVPLTIEDGVLQVGIVDAENTQAFDALQFLSSKSKVPFKVFIISKQDFDKIYQNYKGIGGEVEKALSEFDVDASAEEVSMESANVQDKLKPGEEEKIVEEAPIIKIVAVLLKTAVEGRASDIHIETDGEKVRVRFRVDGILHTSLVLPMNVYSGVIARVKILSKMRLDEKRKPQDGSFTAKIEGRKIDFRVSTFPSHFGEKVVLRILDKEIGVKTLQDLRMSEKNLSFIKTALAKPYGLILITGPTGSGKSTTLCAMLNELDREKSNVVSLEDPVEYNVAGVNQSQVMPEIGYTFASGLRSILRQDPDIIMVGEIRDKETAQLAIQAALTGHLVLSTLHTNNAIGAIPRLVDMGVDPYLIAPTLILTIAQRLVREICPNSKKEVPIDESTRQMLDKEFADLPEEYKKSLGIGNTMYDMVPAPECPSGTSGRLAVYEMFEIDKEMQNVILKNPVESELYKTARSRGMLTMKEDAILKNIKGEIPWQEIYNL